jgi:hypothetical protein
MQKARVFPIASQFQTFQIRLAFAGKVRDKAKHSSLS